MALASTVANLAPAGEDATPRRIQNLERAQAETLPAVMAAIAPMFASINAAVADAQAAITQVTAAQATLSAQQATLTSLVSTQVSVDGKAAGLSYTSVGSSWGTYTTVSFTVPSWATQVVLTGVGVIQAQDTVTGGLAYLDARVALGLASPTVSYSDYITLPVTVGASVSLSSGTPAHTARLTGVSGTVTAAVQLRASNASAYTSTSVSIAATVMATR